VQRWIRGFGGTRGAGRAGLLVVLFGFSWPHAHAQGQIPGQTQGQTQAPAQDQQSPPTIVVFGDSQAAGLARGLQRVLAEDPRFRVLNRTHAGASLVHDQNDGLTINFNGDYPGGVTVVGELVVAGVALSGAINRLQSALIDINSADVRLATLEQTVSSLVTLAGASVIPSWQNKSEVEQGGLTAPSATELGLIVQFQFDRLVPNFNHEDVTGISPPPGSAVRRGSTVLVTINLQG